MKKYCWIRIILTLLAFILLLGDQNNKEAKADFFSTYMVFPFMNHINYFDSIQEKNRMIDSLEVELQRKIIDKDILKTAVIHLEAQLELENKNIVNFDSLSKSYSIIPTKIVANSYDTPSRIIILDKGMTDNITVNDPVVCQYGVVGRVVAVNHTKCTVLPFSNVKSQLAVMNQKNVQGILKADHRGRLTMCFIEKNSSIAVGDTIITSNLSSIFKDYHVPLGSVSNVSLSDNQLYLEALVTPFTQINNLSSLFIVKSNVEKTKREYVQDKQTKEKLN